MKKLLFSFLHILAGLVCAFIVMMVFEVTNSLFFPFPEGFDMYAPQAVQDFAKQHEPYLYFMVLAGWIGGSFVGGFVTTKLSQEKVFRFSLIVGIFLTGLGILNNMMISHPLWFNIVGMPMFLVMSYFGFRAAKK